MKFPALDKIKAWIQTHPGIFRLHEKAGELVLLELYSNKNLHLKGSQLQTVEEKKNRLNPQETYLVVLFSSGQQVALSPQGFAFPPDFSHTGTIPLPSKVYCMQDFRHLRDKLRHLAAETERRQEALALIMVLIAILDGAKAIGLEVEEETREVDGILSQLETGQPSPSPHKD